MFVAIILVLWSIFYNFLLDRFFVWLIWLLDLKNGTNISGRWALSGGEALLEHYYSLKMWFTKTVLSHFQGVRGLFLVLKAWRSQPPPSINPPTSLTP